MNRFYEIPIEELKEIDPEWETRRMNADGTKAIIHVETLDELITKINAGVMALDEDAPDPAVPYPIYQGEGLAELLNTPEWNPEQEGTVSK